MYLILILYFLYCQLRDAAPWLFALAAIVVPACAAVGVIALGAR